MIHEIIYNLYIMRFLTLLREKTVPEWEHCYYDY